MRQVVASLLLAAATAAGLAAWLAPEATTGSGTQARAGAGGRQADAREAEETTRASAPPRLEGRAPAGARPAGAAAGPLDGMPEHMACAALCGRVVDARTGNGVPGAWVALQAIPPVSQVLIH